MVVGILGLGFYPIVCAKFSIIAGDIFLIAVGVNSNNSPDFTRGRCRQRRRHANDLLHFRSWNLPAIRLDNRIWKAWFFSARFLCRPQLPAQLLPAWFLLALLSSPFSAALPSPPTTIFSARRSNHRSEWLSPSS